MDKMLITRREWMKRETSKRMGAAATWRRQPRLLSLHLTQPAAVVDTRPGVPTGERFKALGGGYNSGSPKADYWALVSGDGIQWRKLRKNWVIDRSNWSHASDSTPACVFWSEAERQYVAYIRIRIDPTNSTQGKVGGLRWIGRLTSDDFIHWSKVTPMRTYSRSSLGHPIRWKDERTAIRTTRWRIEVLRIPKIMTVVARAESVVVEGECLYCETANRSQ